jgi:hypothetical protein
MMHSQDRGVVLSAFFFHHDAITGRGKPKELILAPVF